MFSIKLTQTNWRKSILRDLQEKKETFHMLKSQQRHQIITRSSTSQQKPQSLLKSLKVVWQIAETLSFLCFFMLSTKTTKRFLIFIDIQKIPIITIINKAHFKTLNRLHCAAHEKSKSDRGRITIL